MLAYLFIFLNPPSLRIRFQERLAGEDGGENKPVDQRNLYTYLARTLDFSPLASFARFVLFPRRAYSSFTGDLVKYVQISDIIT